MDVNSWLDVALPGIPIINHFLQLYKSICAFCRHTDNKRPPSSLISIKTTIIFGISGNLLFHDFRSYVVKFMVPIFLVHIWNDLPPPLKRGHATPSGLCVRHFVFFEQRWLATATWLAVPQAAQQQQTLGLLVTFYFALLLCSFHSQLQRVTEHPLFMTTILLKDCSLRLQATQRLAQGCHPYYASCIVSIFSVFFGAGIKLLQILLVPVIHGISLGIKLLQISLVPVIYAITLARLTLILKVTSTEKYDVRRLKPP